MTEIISLHLCVRPVRPLQKVLVLSSWWLRRQYVRRLLRTLAAKQGIDQPQDVISLSCPYNLTTNELSNECLEQQTSRSYQLAPAYHTNNLPSHPKPHFSSHNFISHGSCTRHRRDPRLRDRLLPAACTSPFAPHIEFNNGSQS